MLLFKGLRCHFCVGSSAAYVFGKQANFRFDTTPSTQTPRRNRWDETPRESVRDAGGMTPGWGMDTPARGTTDDVKVSVIFFSQDASFSKMVVNLVAISGVRNIIVNCQRPSLYRRPYS